MATLSVRLSEAHWKQIQERAAASEVDLSELVRRILTAYFGLEDQACVQTRLRDGQDASGVLWESIERYDALLSRALATLRETFTPSELSLLVEVCNGVLFQGWSIPHLASEVEDALALDHLDQKWGVDGEALLTKLRALDLAATYALVDKIERFWNAVSCGEAREPSEVLTAAS